jgi:DNA-directed RNA polymerase I subunit RPA2
MRESCPSFRRGHLPNTDDVNRLRSLTKPHVDSFNYFLEIGLPRGIKDIERAEIDLIDAALIREEGLKSVDFSEVSTVQFWVEDVRVAKPSKSGCGRSDELLPRECRERSIMYSGEISGKFCYQVIHRRNGIKIDSKTVKIQKSFGKLPIMLLSKACHLANASPESLVKMKEEVRTYYVHNKYFYVLVPAYLA